MTHEKKDEMKMWAGGLEGGWNIRNFFYWEQSSLAATEEKSLNVRWCSILAVKGGSIE